MKVTGRDARGVLVTLVLQVVTSDSEWNRSTHVGPSCRSAPSHSLCPFTRGACVVATRPSRYRQTVDKTLKAERHMGLTHVDWILLLWLGFKIFLSDSKVERLLYLKDLWMELGIHLTGNYFSGWSWPTWTVTPAVTVPHSLFHDHRS